MFMVYVYMLEGVSADIFICFSTVDENLSMLWNIDVIESALYCYFTKDLVLNGKGWMSKMNWREPC